VSEYRQLRVDCECPSKTCSHHPGGPCRRRGAPSSGEPEDDRSAEAAVS
jgi:hypothetical protein